MNDPISEEWAKTVSAFAYRYAKALDDALRDAVRKNECPQCKAGVHPEALVIFEDWQPHEYTRDIPRMTKTVLICCVRCADIMREIRLRSHESYHVNRISGQNDPKNG